MDEVKQTRISARPYVEGKRVRVIKRGDYYGREYIVIEMIEGGSGGHYDNDYEGWRQHEPTRIWVRELDGRLGPGFEPNWLEHVDA